MLPPVVAVVLIIAIAGYFLAKRRALVVSGGRSAELHSRPGYYASYVALLAVGPAVALWAVWRLLEPTILRSLVLRAAPTEVTSQSPEAIKFFMSAVRRIADGMEPTGEVTAAIQAAGEYYGTLQTFSRIALLVAGVALAAFCLSAALRNVNREFRARNVVERWVVVALWIAAGISVATTAGIIFSVLFESIRFFGKVPITEFLFGLQWSPQTALRADQVGSSGAFGAVPLFAGTILITVIAMLVAGPIGMFSAIYLSQYADPRFRSAAKPILEILAGIPTVVYGFFAALTVAPLVRRLGESIGLEVSSESALAAGLVMGIMIIPFVSSLADDAISAVPVALRDASFGLGATRAETITQVLIPAALPGIIAGFLLAISRAIGETMIVVMAAGLAGNLTANPLQAVTTVTVQIVTLLVGDQEFDSAKTLSAFALGLFLFVATLCLNVFALYVMKTYREKYD
jgi:phosphate transport system permease protein